MSLSFNNVLHFFLPTVCIQCKKILSFDLKICSGCKKRLKEWSPPFCPICGETENEGTETAPCSKCLQTTPPFRWAHSIFEWNDSIAKLIHSLKYGKQETGVSFMADALEKWIKKNAPNEKWDWIVPVPLHRWRLIRRGFNQSALLGKALGKKLKIPVNFKALMRTEFKSPQVEQSREERIQSVKKIFSVRSNHPFKNKKILLLDDVYTTGATAKACSKILKKSGATVDVLTVARVPLK